MGHVWEGPWARRWWWPCVVIILGSHSASHGLSLAHDGKGLWRSMWDWSLLTNRSSNKVLINWGFALWWISIKYILEELTSACEKRIDQVYYFHYHYYYIVLLLRRALYSEEAQYRGILLSLCFVFPNWPMPPLETEYHHCTSSRVPSPNLDNLAYECGDGC